MSGVYIAVFLALSAIIHALLFRFLSGKVFGSVLVFVGASLSVCVYQLWAYVGQGYLDPFFRIAAAVQFGISLVVGIMVLLVFKNMQRRSQQGDSQS